MSEVDYLNLTKSQAEPLEEFRNVMREELIDGKKVSDDTFLLYRFLKARDFDIEKATVMIKKFLQWMKQNYHIIRNYKPTDFLKNYLSKLHIGFDKEGCPIIYIAAGNYDVKGIHMATRYSDIEKYLIQQFDKVQHYLEAKGRITKLLIIFNDKGLTFANTVNKNGLETMLRLVKLQQDIFPERLKAIYFINVPSYFTVAFNLVKNFISEDTLKKFQVHGTEGWQEGLLNLIDADQLPVFLGGTRTDPDGNPLCQTILNQGGPVDESYYIHRSKTSLAKCPKAEKLSVSRWSSKEIRVEVAEAGSVIEWEFETTAGDVIFGVHFVGRDAEVSEEVLPPQRLSTKDFAEVGMYKCEKPGTYVLVFDNSYSWLHSKEIYYKIKLVKSSDLEEEISD